MRGIVEITFGGFVVSVTESDSFAHTFKELKITVRGLHVISGDPIIGLWQLAEHTVKKWQWQKACKMKLSS